MSRDIPIIFSHDMVLALLAGRKTMTRRLLYSKRKNKKGGIPANATMHRQFMPPPATAIHIEEYFTLSGWQNVKPGDRLWVRENLTCIGDGIWHYAADKAKLSLRRADLAAATAWAHHEERGIVPSIHMPRFATRIVIEITDVKIEPLQKISREDAKREGVDLYHLAWPQWPVWFDGMKPPEANFESLWRSLHDRVAWASWDANPAVVAIGGVVHLTHIDALPRAA